MRWRYAVAALLIGVVGVLWVKSKMETDLSAEGTVQAYFAALADRDGDKARVFLARHEDEEVETVLLGEETIRNPAYAPPSDLWTRLEHQESSLTAIVQARYRIAGRQYNREFHLRREFSGTQWHIYQGWSNLPAQTRTVFPLRIAGTEVGRDPSGYVPAFPGAYRVEMIDNDIFTSTPVTVVAGTEAPGLVLRLRREHHGKLDQQVRQYLDGCAARAVPDPLDCPFDPAEGTGYPADFLRKITDYPRLMFWVERDGTISASGEAPGRLEVIGKNPDGSAWLIATETFDLIGSLKLAGKSFTFLPT